MHQTGWNRHPKGCSEQFIGTREPMMPMGGLERGRNLPGFAVIVLALSFALPGYAQSNETQGKTPSSQTPQEIPDAPSTVQPPPPKAAPAEAAPASGQASPPDSS